MNFKEYKRELNLICKQNPVEEDLYAQINQLMKKNWMKSIEIMKIISKFDTNGSVSDKIYI